jgi:hypothetical protein
VKTLVGLWSAAFVVLFVGACSDGKLDAFEIAQSASAAGGSSGGAGGAAGAASGGTPPATLLIDDFEDGDTQAKITEGWWYALNDGTGQQTFGVSAANRPGSNFAAHTQGGGFAVWGAAVGLDLTGSTGKFDASSYSLLNLWLKTGSGTPRTLSVQLLDTSSAHFATDVTPGSDWQEYSLPLTDFVRTEGDLSAPMDQSSLAALQIFMLSSDDFDFWVDDLSLSRGP